MTFVMSGVRFQPGMWYLQLGHRLLQGGANRHIGGRDMGAVGARQLLAGMVGGGVGADIGKTHRFAMRLDDRYALVAGVFGQDPQSSKQLGKELDIAEDRIYPSYREMAEREAARPDGIDLAVVATPNDSHFAIASTFLFAGISVICEKPLTQDSDSAAELIKLADQ
ncbi:MAG TPA: Gfo/Idh/MocA family oxidoreductase, partial [Propionibacteriaceae bacterium]|nr:Gfo/Idh/MocA family oxidoreductase [Propionibacteriaceae bacterium]